MKELTKLSVDWKKLTIVVALVLLTGLTTSGLTWYVADSGRDAELDAKDSEITSLQTKIAQLEADATEEGDTTKAETDETASWKTYTNKAFGFSFKYPENYTLETEGTPQINNFQNFASINLKDNERAGNPSLKILVNPDGLGGCGSDSNDYGYTTEIKNGGVAVTKKSLGIKDCDTSESLLRIVTTTTIGKPQPSNFLLLEFDYQKSTSNNYQAEFDQILKTFRINDSTIYGY